MKKKVTIIALIFAVCCLAHQGMAQPIMLIESPVFIFESVPEGSSIPHEFKVKNMGDSVLEIQKVLPP